MSNKVRKLRNGYRNSLDSRNFYFFYFYTLDLIFFLSKDLETRLKQNKDANNDLWQLNKSYSAKTDVKQGQEAEKAEIIILWTLGKIFFYSLGRPEIC